MKQMQLEFRDWRDDRIEDLEAQVAELERQLNDAEADYEYARDEADEYRLILEDIRSTMRGF